jgi:hypothetical protein
VARSSKTGGANPLSEESSKNLRSGDARVIETTTNGCEIYNIIPLLVNWIGVVCQLTTCPDRTLCVDPIPGATKADDDLSEHHPLY